MHLYEERNQDCVLLWMLTVGLTPDEPQSCPWEAGTICILSVASLAVISTR